MCLALRGSYNSQGPKNSAPLSRVCLFLAPYCLHPEKQQNSALFLGRGSACHLTKRWGKLARHPLVSAHCGVGGGEVTTDH